jgi:catechol 2,3-dioxygenase-like lactoylglutathione lyase family enzyme
VLAHVSIQCRDPDASRAFYEALLAPIGGKALIEHGPYVGFGREVTGSLFFIGPVDTPGGPHDDVHIAFDAASHDEVDAFVAAGRALGAEVLHEPQEWWYAPGYYGGFVRDPDGNNVEARYLPGALQ